MLAVIRASLLKEGLLLSRDLHAILVLFIMPIVFILIMSLALQDTFEGKKNVSLKGHLKILQPGLYVQYFTDALNENPFFSRLESSADTVQSTAHYTLVLTNSFEATIVEGLQQSPAITLEFSPEIGMRERALVLAGVQEAFAVTNVSYLAEDLGYDQEYGKKTFLKQGAIQLKGQSNSGDTKAKLPNSTQQNVPAWLVFSMFFISIPISTTMISERQQKTLMRLRTMNISPSVLYFSKLLPYFVINFVQLGLMLLVGVLLLPILGGQALNLDVSVFALLIVCASISISALGYAALVATLCKTTEQATMISGVGSIILGALGGIMVPTFIMPSFMQELSKVSPMGWGLQGFIDVFVHGGGIASILPECLVLVFFGATLIFVALTTFKLKRS